VHIPKSGGGERPLSMLEGSLECIEGVASRRRVRARKGMVTGQIYSPSNLAGEPGHQATAEVLYVDCLVCEDSLRHGQPLCRIGADYVKFYSTIARPACDAVEECRGIPDDARRLMHEAFGGFQVAIEMWWGPTDPVDVERGMPRGSVSGPEIGKPGLCAPLAAAERRPLSFILRSACGVRRLC
jgi:hypothetical protein